MLKLPAFVAVAALLAVVHVDASFAQSAPPADKPAATDATADKSNADKSAEKPAPKKKKAKKMTRQQEIDKSVDTGTVPARYRSSVPKEYHQYIPFAR